MFTVIVLSLAVIGIIINRARVRAQQDAEYEHEQRQVQWRLLHY
jgi:hypothetical protein